MEIAQWFLSPEDRVVDNVSRIYFGHETCFSCMPECDHVMRTLEYLGESQKRATLVMPCLTDEELKHVCSMIEASAARFDRIEVVSNDWGLLHWLVESGAADPVVGRLLVGQATDPRLAALDWPERQQVYQRIIRHAEGTEVELRYRRPTRTLMNNLKSCAIAIPDVLSCLHDLGIRRFEISNPLQGIYLPSMPGWDITLHLPEVVVAIANDQFKDGCKKWLHHSFPVQLNQRDNIVFYNNDKVPVNIEELGVTRFVYRSPEHPAHPSS